MSKLPVLDYAFYSKKEKGIVMKILMVVLVLSGLVFFNSSCNMLEGAGQDIGNAGDAIKDATN